MRKLITLALAMFTIFISVDAQQKKPFQFGIGANLLLPNGDFKYSSNFGAGVRAQLEVPFGEQITALASASFNRLFYTKSVRAFSDKSGLNVAPIQVGARFYPTGSLFAGIQAGYGFLSGGSASDRGFSFNPHVGFNAEQFQMILGYNSISRNGNFSWFEVGGVIKL